VSRARDTGVLLAVLAGIIALSLLGDAAAVASPVVGLVVLIAPFVRGRLRWLPWPLLTGPFMLLVVLWLWLAGGDRRAALALALLYLQAHRALSRSSESDDRVSLLLSGLMMVATASGTQHVGFLGCVVMWAFALPLALLPKFSVDTGGHGWLALTLSGATVLGASLVFVVAPRGSRDGVSGGARGMAVTGFSDAVELGSLDTLLDDSQEVFRVSMEGGPTTPMYFRGNALELFDGRNWWSEESKVNVQLAEPSSFPAGAQRYSVALQPSQGGILFTTGEVLHVEAEDHALLRDDQGAWSVDADQEPVRYQVVSTGELGASGRLGSAEASVVGWTRVPVSLDPRIESLARTLVGEEREAMARALLISDHLRDAYVYTRMPRAVGDGEPLSTFLFERRSGHCEYFASAHAVLLRTLGVPTRLVTGFVGGDWDPERSEWVFRGHHAHAWTEVYVPDAGWVLVDATPGAQAVIQPPVVTMSALFSAWWRDTVLSFDQQDQVQMVKNVGHRVEQLAPVLDVRTENFPWRGLVLLMAMSGVLGAVLRIILSRWVGRLAGAPSVRRRRDDPVGVQLDRAHDHLESRGWQIPTCLPPVEAARWVQQQTQEDAEALEALSWMYYAVRYGGDSNPAYADRARHLAERVMRLGPPRARS
jgi:protein-glutamine gamma-glutamyltransferase